MSDMLTRRIIEQEEGWRDTPYYDHLGYPTVGYGFNLHMPKNAPLPGFVLPKAAGDAWLQSFIDAIRSQLEEELSWMNEDRQSIIISMAYQMGIKGVLGFGNMWSAIRRQDWDSASDEMLDSRWARQTPARAHRHATVMQTGSAKGVY